MLIFDPFVGTGGLLVAAHHFGAVGIGCDIDVRVLKGWGVSYLNAKYQSPTAVSTTVPSDGNESSNTDIFVNFDAYSLPRPDVLRADNSARVWHLQELPFKRRPWVDAIVTDPPYGIRAAARQSGRSCEHGNCRPTTVRTNEERLTHMPATISYSGGSSGVVNDLIGLAQDVLVDRGRLVFLLPVELSAASQTLQDFNDNVFTSAGFTLLCAGLQPLSAGLGRYLVTLMKTTSR